MPGAEHNSSERPGSPPDVRSGRGGGRRGAVGFVAVLAASAGLAALMLFLFPEDEAEPGAGATVAAFQPRYSQLEERRLSTGVSTMGEPQDPTAHTHPRLAIYANGSRIRIPVNIGIDPAQPPDRMASLHTHESDGTIHVEGMATATLGQLFAIWGVPFSPERLGPFQSEAGSRVRMWVEGSPSREFGALELSDGQEIVIAFGAREERPASLNVE